MNKQYAKIIFFGTSDFAAIILNKLLQTAHCQLAALVTQPDKPAGRKKKLTPPPVKILAQQKNIPVLQPAKLDNNFNQKISALKPNLFIVAEYGNLLPGSTLAIPKHGALNVHPSLLPEYRGPSPMQTALLNDDRQTGITIIKMDEKMDNGPIINQQESIIDKQDTYTSLSKKLAEQSADLLIKTIPDYINKKIKPKKQKHAQASFTKIIKKEDGLITKNKTAEQVFNMWRAYQPWPGVFIESRIKNKELRIKLIKIELTNLMNKKNNPLELFIENNSLYLLCANRTVLKINCLQLNGKKSVDAQSFINGYMK
ncbi:methionyl-tRNA formyltransferase [Candidatus Kuenenbacteria bacterium RIFCSPHIGHO2_02_FULL_39_13]|uniref:Methionyl-tRNA formyltransferase n=1 Tax=Candidatus Kuenenbacteria bacterium RIFCSPHIGHO2_02_FULL_39_13 TaxID=1798561 RepID=A0A1F6FP80_9BACT|nr:MAG: methionyl-tRNA formyltransferase [Candidatus Kuenenbacteria bacterium RIFCSPHIGHO2_02_FULL_39_13]